MEEMFSLTGRTALVTGSSRGLGFAMAKGLAQAGAHVFLNGRDAVGLEAKARTLRNAGLHADIAPFDATDEVGGRAAIEAIVSGHGHLDILIANAGMNIRKPTLEVTTDEWRQIVDLNLTACFTIARDAAREMVKCKWGRIIFTGSVLSKMGRPTTPAYTATKHGVLGLTKSLGAEFGRDGVTVNGIGPGFFKTELNIPLLADKDFTDWVEMRTPLGRWAEPDEIAGAAVFLSSDAAAYVNGHMLMVDGGMTINA